MPGIANDEVMHADAVRLALSPPRAAGILEIADQLLFLGVDRDGRLSAALCARDGLGDISKLCVPIGMLTAFSRLDVALEGVAQLVQQVGDDGMADGVTEGLQRDGQRPGTLAGPPQRRVRIAGRRRCVRPAWCRPTGAPSHQKDYGHRRREDEAPLHALSTPRLAQRFPTNRSRGGHRLALDGHPSTECPHNVLGATSPSADQSLEVAMGSTRIQAFSISAPAALVAVVLAVGSLAQATAAANELKTIEIVLVDETA